VERDARVELPGIEPGWERRSRARVRLALGYGEAAPLKRSFGGAAGNRTRVLRPRNRASTSVVRG